MTPLIGQGRSPPVKATRGPAELRVEGRGVLSYDLPTILYKSVPVHSI